MKTWFRIQKFFSTRIFTATGWGVIGGVAAVFSLAFSAYQISQAAEIQRVSLERERRLTMSELALDAQSTAFELVAAVAQSLFNGQTGDTLNSVEVEASDGGDALQPISEAIRLASIKLDGAISRASLIEDEVVKLCLTEMSDVARTLVEVSIPLRTKFDASDIAVALESFAELVGIYYKADPYPTEWLPTKDETGNLRCKIFSTLDLGSNISQSEVAAPR